MKKLLPLIATFFLFASANAQTWSFNCNTSDWITPPPCTINLTPTANSVTANFAPYYSYSTISYTLATPQNISSNATVTFGVSTTSINLNGKYLAVFLQSNVSSNLNLASIVSIPSANQPAAQYSIDFSTIVPASFNLTTVSKVYFWIMDQKGGNSSPASLNGDLTISSVSLGTGTTGSSTLTNVTLGQAWQYNTSDAITNANKGNVLIGNFATSALSSLTSPYYQFVVNGRTNFIGTDNVLGIWSSNLGTNGRHYLGISHSKFSDNVTEFSMINAGEYGGIGYTAKHLILQNSVGNGNIGIGQFTTAPIAKLTVNGKTAIGPKFITSNSGHNDYKLSVDGKIVCQSLYVLSSTGGDWADYVFAKGYKLRTLVEVEKYIEANQHLPNVPSAAEVKEKGIDTGDMLRLQMEKIEELTLYMIEIKKELEVLKKKNQLLEEQLR